MICLTNVSQTKILRAEFPGELPVFEGFHPVEIRSCGPEGSYPCAHGYARIGHGTMQRRTRIITITIIIRNIINII